MKSSDSTWLPKIWIIALLLTGAAFLVPFVNFQGFLSTGDHGRELYAAERVLHGEIPYHDFYWVYGPFMPYYYGFFLKLLGLNIHSVLIGKMLLNLASGFYIFIALRSLWGPVIGLTGASWFFVFHRDFFFTYNHPGGITAIAALIAALMQFLKTQEDRWLWTGAMIAFVLSLIKLNFGAMGILILCFTSWLTGRTFGAPAEKRKKFFYIFSLVILPCLIFAIYWACLHRLSSDEITQCLPYASGNYQQGASPVMALIAFFDAFKNKLLLNRWDLFFAAIVIISGIRTCHLIDQKKFDEGTHKNLLLSLTILAVYYLLNMHEYLKGGVSYQPYWAQPAGLIFMFTLIGAATHTIRTSYQAVVVGSIFFIVIYGHTAQLASSKNSSYFSDPRAQVFIANDAAWHSTVSATVKFLKDKLRPKETFFALPYDPLYYFLTDRKSPTRQLLFFDFLHIPREQEEKIIRELESARVNLVLISSRQRSSETGLGEFGTTYCPLLAKYITANFAPVAMFGDWVHEGGWAAQHGTLILRRIHPLGQ